MWFSEYYDPPKRGEIYEVTFENVKSDSHKKGSEVTFGMYHRLDGGWDLAFWKEGTSVPLGLRPKYWKHIVIPILTDVVER